jgi:hypothetical protein
MGEAIEQRLVLARALNDPIAIALPEQTDACAQQLHGPVLERESALRAGGNNTCGWVVTVWPEDAALSWLQT